MNWIVPSDEPVIRPGQLHGSLDAKRAGACHVIRQGDRYLMSYWGTSDKGEHRCLFAEASVDAPMKWKPAGVALSPEPNGDRGFIGPSMPFLLPVTESRWLMYYCGWLYGGPPTGQRLPNTTGAAISEDAGKTWKHIHPHPILPHDHTYDQSATGSVWVLHDPKSVDRLPFRMYYTAIGKYFDAPQGVTTGHGPNVPEIGIAYAESEDGIHWQKPIDHLLVSPRKFGVEPFEYICSKPCVIDRGVGAKGARYLLWVCTFGYAYRVHHLESDDGITWRWCPRVGPQGELGVGAAGKFDAAMRTYPAIVAHEGRLRCWFTGDQFGCTGMGYAESPMP